MPWAGTWDDDVNVMAIDAVTELGKTVYIYRLMMVCDNTLDTWTR